MKQTTKTTKTTRLIEGLQILNSYPQCETAVGHDELLSGPITARELAVDQQERMIELGWILDEKNDCWKFLL